MNPSPTPESRAAVRTSLVRPSPVSPSLVRTAAVPRPDSPARHHERWWLHQHGLGDSVLSLTGNRTRTGIASAREATCGAPRLTPALLQWATRSLGSVPGVRIVPDPSHLLVEVVGWEATGLWQRLSTTAQLEVGLTAHPGGRGELLALDVDTAPETFIVGIRRLRQCLSELTTTWPDDPPAGAAS